MISKEYEAIYADFIENDNEAASKEVRESYSEKEAAFEEYVCAVQKDMFRKAYQFGYSKGIEAAAKRKTA